jgi:hypothetical protein
VEFSGNPIFAGNSVTPASTSAWQFAHSSTHLRASRLDLDNDLVMPLIPR